MRSRSAVAEYADVDNKVTGMTDMADNMALLDTVRVVMDGRKFDIEDSQAGLMGRQTMWRK